MSRIAFGLGELHQSLEQRVCERTSKRLTFHFQDQGVVRLHGSRNAVVGRQGFEVGKGVHGAWRSSCLGLTHTALQPQLDNVAATLCSIHVLHACQRRDAGRLAAQEAGIRGLSAHHPLA